jgi:hypothetical protein
MPGNDSDIYQVSASNVLAIKYKDGTFYRNPNAEVPAQFNPAASFGSLKPIGMQNQGVTSRLAAASSPTAVNAAFGAEPLRNKRYPVLDPLHMRIAADEITMRSVNNPSINFYLDEASEYRKKRAIGYLAIPAGVAGIVTTLVSAFAESPVGVAAGVTLIGVTGLTLDLSAKNRKKELEQRKKAIETFNQIYN